MKYSLILNNINTILKYASENVENKEEMFNILEVSQYVAQMVSINSTNRKLNCQMNYEEGIPENVFGDMLKYKQILAILLTLANKESTDDIFTILS
jgi:hypothetical protein